MPTIPYVKQTWADGVSALSAARLTVVENGIYEVSLAPAVHVYHSSNQSISNNTSTTLAFNSERFDTCAGAADTQHDTVTNNSRLTCRYAGKYQITGKAYFASNSTGQRQMFLRLNGSTLLDSDLREPVTTGDGTSLKVETLYDLAVNDYVELLVFQTSGGALNITADGAISPSFMMFRAA